MKITLSVVFVTLAISCQASIAPLIAVPSPAVVRTPQFDSAVIHSDRVGGNFAYSVSEGHAYAAVAPVVRTVSPVLTYQWNSIPVGPHVYVQQPWINTIPVGIHGVSVGVPGIQIPVGGDPQSESNDNGNREPLEPQNGESDPNNDSVSIESAK